MNNDKVLSSLGMAMRAGKVITGDEIVEKAIRTGKTKLVIIANDASDNTKKKFTDKCNSYNVKIAFTHDRETLGKAIGKLDRVVIAITDVQFSKLIAGHISQ